MINLSSNSSVYRFAKYIEETISEVGQFAFFTKKAIASIFKPPSRLRETFKHIDFVGNHSFAIIILTGTFTGLALTFQIWLGFNMFSAGGLVGPTVALAILRELGPVLTGLVISARAGGAMAAQLGTMRVSEQIDALEVIGVDPIQYLVSPRVVAATIGTPLMCAVFDFMSLMSSYFLSIYFLGLDEGSYWDKIGQWIEFSYLVESLFKATVFGFFFGLYCTFAGFNTTGGARGVGQATNKGVVTSMVMAIVLDYILSNFIRLCYLVT
jgi:phospholipid/cholesterol/gamma-HCH transport system permease protein